MRAIILKAAREVWFATLLVGLALVLVETALTMILPQMQAQIGDMLLQMPFVRTMMSTLIGTDAGDALSNQILNAICWVHPVVLALIWGHEIVFCTRFPAGEIDRGTVDVLLGLPVNRRAAYVGESVVWLATGIFILAAGWRTSGPAFRLEPRNERR